ncbi:MAG: DUF348 domain-containing protein [Anaerolineae bacterium]|nr:DUF348 domain-containing protein [Anaerolineae bacterium]
MSRWRSLLIALAAIVALVLCAVVALFISMRPQAVTLIVNGEAIAAQTHAQTVRELLRERGISLNQGDQVQPGLETPLSDDLVVQVIRARVVTLIVDGQLSVLNTMESNPADILDAANVAVDDSDRIIVDGTRATPEQLRNWPVPVNSLTIRRSIPVRIDDDGTQFDFRTTADTVGEALYEADITLYLADQVTPGADEPVRPDLQIAIRRARPITILSDGASIQTRVQGTTVSDALANAGVALIGLDYTIPSEQSRLVQGMTIRVIRVEETVLVDETDLPYETVYQADDTLELDQRRVLQTGQIGKQRTVTRVRLENGAEVGRQVEETTVVSEAVNHVIAYGTNVVIRTIDTPQGPRQYWRRLRMYATSYHPAALGGDDVTATGRRLTTGIVASNPNAIPYGTEVYVENYGVGLMADTGGPRRFALWIDLGYSDEDFVSWSRYVDVYLLTPVPDEIDYTLPGT